MSPWATPWELANNLIFFRPHQPQASQAGRELATDSAELLDHVKAGADCLRADVIYDVTHHDRGVRFRDADQQAVDLNSGQRCSQ